MKAWEDMDSKERAEATFNAIKKRQAKRDIEKARGRQDAIDYGFDQAAKSIRMKSKIRCKSYRG